MVVGYLLLSLVSGALCIWVTLSFLVGRDPGGMIAAWQAQQRMFGFRSRSENPKLILWIKVWSALVPAFVSALAFVVFVVELFRRAPD